MDLKQRKGRKAEAILKQLRDGKPEELSQELLKLRKEQFSLRLLRATGQPMKPDQFTKVRRGIARLKTITREAQVRAAGEKK